MKCTACFKEAHVLSLEGQDVALYQQHLHHLGTY